MELLQKKAAIPAQSNNPQKALSMRHLKQMKITENTLKSYIEAMNSVNFRTFRAIVLVNAETELLYLSHLVKAKNL